MKFLPPHPNRPADRGGRLLDASLHLLDRTVTDREDVPVGIVDDVEIDLNARDRPVITHLDLSASLFAPLRRGRDSGGSTQRVPWRVIRALDSAVHLKLARDDVATTASERRLRDRFIRRIPGGRHAPE